MTMTTRNDIKTESKKWFHFPLVWMIVLIPLSSVFVGIFMLYKAITTYDGLVEDDYYKKGKQISLTMARDDFARTKQIQAEIFFDIQGSNVRGYLTGEGLTLPGTLQLKLLHPTQNGKDVTVQWLRQNDDSYLGTISSNIADGNWLLRIEHELFRLQKRIKMPADKAVEISASPDGE